MWSHNPSSPPPASSRGIFSVNVRVCLKNLHTQILTQGLGCPVNFVQHFQIILDILFPTQIIPIQNNFTLGIRIKVNKGYKVLQTRMTD